MSKTDFFNNFFSIVNIYQKELNLTFRQVIILQLFFYNVYYLSNNTVNIKYIMQKTGLAKEDVSNDIKYFYDQKYFLLKKTGENVFIDFESLYITFFKKMNDIDVKRKINNITNLKSKKASTVNTQEIQKLKVIKKINWLQ